MCYFYKSFNYFELFLDYCFFFFLTQMDMALHVKEKQGYYSGKKRGKSLSLHQAVDR